MGYDPQTVAHEIKYPWRAHSKKWCDAKGYGPDDFMRRYRPSFITIWHVDPERPNTGNRRDDSCGWFDRTPGDYADAVAYVLKDKAFVHEVNLVLQRRTETKAVFYEGISEEQLSWPKLCAADALALTLLVAQELETRRWWNGQDGKRGAANSFWARVLRPRRRVTDEAIGLALNPLDNLSSVDSPEKMVRLVAAALNRRFKPWWRHPRWHVHHWRFQVHPWQQFKRWAFVRCAGCNKGFRWNESVWGYGDNRIFHDTCDEHGANARGASFGIGAAE
jgi:hypothetical protein